MTLVVDPNLPLADLHRHLEGSIRLPTVIEVAQAKGITLPSYDLTGLQKMTWLKEPTSDILNILPRFSILTSALVDYEIIRRVTWEVLEDASREGLTYLELRFSPLFMAEPHKLDPMSVTAAVCEAWQESQYKLPLHARLIVILSRTYGAEACLTELQAALAYRLKGICGIDLAGDEARFPPQLFIEHYRKARQAGLHLSVHAGEFAGAESVRVAVNELKAERIGHGVHAVDDPSVMDLLMEKGVAVECCPTSNYYTCSVANYQEHPLPKFVRHGVRATLNADDPALFSDITIQNEYQVARQYMGLSDDELRQVQRNGIDAAFLTQEEKRDIWRAFPPAA